MDKYLSLITSEHQNQPKFAAWLAAATDMIEDIQNFLSSLYAYYDIDTAVGTQIDALGVILGTSRRLPFQPSNNVSPILDDENYRLLLKSVIAESRFDGTISSLYEIFQVVLGDTGLYFVPIDNQNMTISVIVYGATTTIIQDLLTHGYIIPRPEAVSLTLNVTTNKVFSWGVENTIFGGWGEGYWLLQGGN